MFLRIVSYNILLTIYHIFIHIICSYRDIGSQNSLQHMNENIIYANVTWNLGLLSVCIIFHISLGFFRTRQSVIRRSSLYLKWVTVFRRWSFLDRSWRLWILWVGISRLLFSRLSSLKFWWGTISVLVQPLEQVPTAVSSFFRQKIYLLYVFILTSKNI